MEHQDVVIFLHFKELSRELAKLARRALISKVLARKGMLDSSSILLCLFFFFLSEVRCPALPKVPVGTYIPANCDDGPMRFHSNCELRCPDGYHIATRPESQTSISRICGTDGAWTHVAVSPTCKGVPKKITIFMLIAQNYLPRTNTIFLNK